MRLIIVVPALFFLTSLHAQNVSPLGFAGYAQHPSLFNKDFNDSAITKKWSFNSFTGISTGLVFYKGAHAGFLAAPLGLQLNRKINKNLYAFTSVAAIPAYFNYSNNFSYLNAGKVNGLNNFTKSNNFNLSSRVDVGLTYVNDAKTFSISGSVGVERSNEPVFIYNRSNTNQNPPAKY